MFPLNELMLAALLVAGQDAPPAPPAPAPASEAQVDRFLAVLPGHERLEQTDFDVDPAELERLGTLNPNHVDEIRGALDSYADCAGLANARLSTHIMRTVARALGDEKLGRMVAFYEHEDLAVLGPLMDRAGRGDSLSAAEQAEVDRIRTAYPIEDFGREMTSFNPAFLDEPLLSAINACEQARDAAFERIGVVQSAEEAEPGFDVGGAEAE